MLSPAQNHIITRALTDAYDAKVISSTALKKLQRAFEITCDATRRDTGRALQGLCGQADSLTPRARKNDQFLTPQYLVDNARLLLSAVGHIERARKKGQKPPTLSKMAELLKVDAAQIRLAIAQVFVNPNPSYQQLLDLCDLNEPKKKKGEAGLEDPDGIGHILKFALCRGRLPNNAEAQEMAGCSARRLQLDIQEALIDDLHRIADRFDDKGFSINDVILNRYSYYYREYGIRSYYLFFDDDLEPFFESLDDLPDVTVEVLRNAFKPQWHLNLYEMPSDPHETRTQSMPWLHVPDSLVAQLDAVESDEEALSLVESHFGAPFSSRIRKLFKADAAKAILKFWNEHDMCFAPRERLFACSQDSLDRLFGHYGDLMNIMDSFALPFKVRVRLLHLKFAPEELIRRIQFFEDSGVPSEYYVPYLVLLGKNHYLRCSCATRIRGAICAEQRMHQTSGRVQPDGIVEKISTAPTGRWPALFWLQYELGGEGYDTFTPRNKRQLTPEMCAHYGRLFSALGWTISNTEIRDWSPDRIQQDGASYIKERISASQEREKTLTKYDQFLETRGFDSFDGGKYVPSAGFLTRVKKKSFVAKVYEIENYLGFQLFTPENFEIGLATWTLLTVTPRELGVKLASFKCRIDRSSRKKDLGALYGIDNMESLASNVRSMTPEELWKRLRLLHGVDLDYEDVTSSKVGHSLPRFQDHLYHRLTKRPPEPLTPNQRHFLAQYELADRAARFSGWEDARDYFIYAAEDEIPGLQKAVSRLQSNPNAGRQWKKKLQKRAQNEKDVLRELLHTDASFSRMNLLLSRFSRQELLERFHVFDDTKKAVDVDLLFLKPEDIRKALDAA